MTHEPPAQPESRWTKRITILVLVCMLVTFLGGVVTVIWIGLHVLDARHDVPVLHRASVPSLDSRIAASAQSQNMWAVYQWQLHSAKPFDEVRIPFVQPPHKTLATTYWLIFVKSTLSGKTLQCALDTGSTVVSWPQSLSPKGEHHGNGLALGSNNSQRSIDIVTLPSVAIGDYELSSLPTSMIQSGAQERGAADVVPVIGNAAFYNVVLTIDYQNKVVLLRNSNYDAVHQTHSVKDLLFDFEWVNGCPTVNGTIEGHPAKFLVDTGCGNDILISKHFSNSCMNTRRGTKANGFGAFGRTEALILDRVDCVIGGKNISSKNVGVVDAPIAQDAIIGNAFLSQYDVTIDYPRRKILLHRNTLPDTTGNNL